MFCTNCGQPIADNAAVCVNCGVACGTERKYCANCGKEVNPNQAICVGCGCALGAQQTTATGVNTQNLVMPSGKSAGLATFLSCLITGLGEVYLGQTMKGLAMFAGALVIGGLTGGVLAPVIWIVTMVDAYKIGKKLEAGQCVQQWEFF